MSDREDCLKTSVKVTMYKVLKLLVMIFLPLPAIALTEKCNEEIALENGIEAIKGKFPQFYESKKPFKLVVMNESWVVLGNTPS